MRVVARFGAAALAAFCLVGCAQRTPTAQPPTTDIEQPPPAPAQELPPVAREADRTRGVIDGLAGLKVGMPVDVLIQRVGKPVRTASREQERADWEEAGYSTARSVIFAIGFDEVLVFEPAGVPLFKAYVAKGRVRTLKFVLYGSEALLAESPAGFGNDCVLGGPASAVVRCFGDPQVKQHEEAMSTLDKAHYFNRGITVTIEEGKIVVFDIYAPPDASTESTLLDALRSERREL